jgi:threonine dehydratase
MFDRDALIEAARLVYRHLPPTPQYAWPLLGRRVGADVWVKHENHTPIGAFKVRGGVVFADRLKRARPDVAGIVSATRGNHGQSLAFAARNSGLRATICVPVGNSVEKNAAMRALGAELVEHGEDFDAARERAQDLARERGLHMVPSFHPDLVLGVATYARELYEAAPDLDTVYCPIGLGSGISGLVLVRDLMGLKTKVVGVVAAGAPTYAHSYRAKRAVPTNAAKTLADGMAVRIPDERALDIMLKGVERMVEVTDAEIGAAMRALYEDTHNLAEGAGAAALAALMQERGRQKGKKVAVVLSGGNIDRALYLDILRG